MPERGGTRGRDENGAGARGLVQLEGYLLWNAEIEDARGRAARFCEQLPWLTTAQREDVERAYIADRLAASRAMLVRISERAAGLRGEYTERYRTLRTRCVAAAVVAVGAASGACTAVTYLTR
ncbi:hypothetical protein KQY30_32970 [Streptomyces sp. GMY02]|uniref:hypothetical protein n=1 Tax=Streptomyces sp. GMY02 TaxID=1333528 RepID=UPI001C2BFB5F|nr:hypothetical protein [Streptomyces sp. GMY02]QXE38335.1 hypothetical protein KQY30_32970 [Streptomyces sp. GMY02]